MHPRIESARENERVKRKRKRGSARRRGRRVEKNKSSHKVSQWNASNIEAILRNLCNNKELIAAIHMHRWWGRKIKWSRASDWGILRDHKFVESFIWPKFIELCVFVLLFLVVRYPQNGDHFLLRKVRWDLGIFGLNFNIFIVHGCMSRMVALFVLVFQPFARECWGVRIEWSESCVRLVNMLRNTYAERRLWTQRTHSKHTQKNTYGFYRAF